MAKNIMIQGTMSNAGKSLLAAGLCRIFKQDGYRVAPFKSQNMALNSFITEAGGEMGRAQVVQAEAAGVKPDVRMNPILLKPTTDVGSQVIVNGVAMGNMRAMEYYRRKREFIPQILEAYNGLAAENDIIVIEGAGSPAEINLKENDIVNMGLAEMVDAPVILVGDIDRGGVFAQLYGTVMLLPPQEQRRIKGMIINKFRGDVTLLDSGIQMLEEKTGIPVIGTVPYCPLNIDDEDSLSTRFEGTASGLVNIGVLRLPRISNFTDVAPFEMVPGVGIRYITRPEELAGVDMVIMPGTKNTIGDLRWLWETGLAEEIRKMAEQVPVFGICGGYQMLGRRVSDPDSVEEGGCLKGLGLLPGETVLKRQKNRQQVEGRMTFRTGILGGLADAKYRGYEIHMGETRNDGGEVLTCRADGGENGIQQGNVYGTYVHGIFDTGNVAEEICRTLAAKKSVVLPENSGESFRQRREKEYDRLADLVRESLDMERIYGMLREAAWREE